MTTIAEIRDTTSRNDEYFTLLNTIQNGTPTLLDVSNGDFANGSLVVYPDYYILNGVKISHTVNASNPLIIRLTEDISFNPNTVNDGQPTMEAWRVPTDSEYANITNQGRLYNELDFWGCIILAGVDHVMIDLNGFSIEQTLEHGFNQRSHFALIQLSNVPYRGNHGYGLASISDADIRGSSNIIIQNTPVDSRPSLLNSSEYGIHGIQCENIYITSTNDSQFVIKNCKIGIFLENSSSIYLKNVSTQLNHTDPAIEYQYRLEERWTLARIFDKFIQRLINDGRSYTNTTVGNVKITDIQTSLREYSDILNQYRNDFDNTNFTDTMTRALFVSTAPNSQINTFGIRITSGDDYQDFATERNTQTKGVVRLDGLIRSNIQSAFRETICSYSSTSTNPDGTTDNFDIEQSGIENIHRDIFGGVADIYPQKIYEENGAMGGAIQRNLSWLLENNQYIVNENNPIFTAQLIFNFHRDTLKVDYSSSTTKSNIPDAFIQQEGENGPYVWTPIEKVSDIAMPILNCTARGEFVKPLTSIYLENLEYVYQTLNDTVTLNTNTNASSSIRTLSINDNGLTSNDTTETATLNTLNSVIDWGLYEPYNDYGGRWNEYVQKYSGIRKGQTTLGYPASSCSGLVLSNILNGVIRNMNATSVASYGNASAITLCGQNENVYIESGQGSTYHIRTIDSEGVGEDDYKTLITQYPFKISDVFIIQVDGEYSNVQLNTGDNTDHRLSSAYYQVNDTGLGNERIQYSYNQEEGIIDITVAPSAINQLYGNNQNKKYEVVEKLLSRIRNQRVIDRIRINAQTLLFNSDVIPETEAGFINIYNPRNRVSLSQLQNGEMIYTPLQNFGDYITIEGFSTGNGIMQVSYFAENDSNPIYTIIYPDLTQREVGRGYVETYEGMRFGIGSWVGRWVGTEDNTGNNIREKVYVRQIKPYGSTDNSQRARGYYMVTRLFKNEQRLGDYVQKTRTPSTAGERMLFLKLRNQRK